MQILGLNLRSPFERAVSPQIHRVNSQSRLRAASMEGLRGLGGIMRSIATMFGGARNIYEVFGYKTGISYDDMLLKYTRQDIAGRVVNMPAEATWSLPPKFDGDETLVKAVQDLADRCNLWEVLSRVDKLAGMNPYACVLVGIDDAKPLDTPVKPKEGRKVTFLQPYSMENMKVSSYVTDTSNPRFGKPEFYTMRLVRGSNMGPFQTKSSGSFRSDGTNRVHWSRIIHVAENCLEDEVFGAPRLGRVYNLMDDVLKVGGGSAEVYWLNARGGLHIDLDKEMELDSTDAADLEAEIDDYSNNMRRVIRTRGVKVEPINMTGIDPRQSFEVILSLICASEGIPQRLLLGSEAGQLASEQDRASWAVTIKQRRMLFAAPVVILQLVRLLARITGVDEEKANTMKLKWPEAFQLSPLERAQTGAQQARSAANLVKAIGTPAVPAKEGVKDPETGAVTGGSPGTPAVPALVTVEEAHAIIMQGNDVSQETD